MLIKNRIRSFRNEAQGFLLANLNLRFIAKQQWGALGQLVVQQQEVKEDPLVSGEKIQIEFAFNVVMKSRDFTSGGKGKCG